MSIISNLFVSSEYHTFAMSSNSKVRLTYGKEKIGHKSLDPAAVSDELKKEVANTYFHEGESKGEQADVNYIRITNIVSGLVPQSDVALCVDAAGYRQLQQLGITVNQDQSLTAKVINFFGDYRFRVLKDQEQYGLRTTLFAEKEQICQQAFARLYALQSIEGMFGRCNPKELEEALQKYKAKLRESESTKKYSQRELVATVAPEQKDLTQALKRALSKASDFKEKLLILNLISLREEEDRIDNLIKGIKGCGDKIKFPIEQFVRDTTNKIIDDAKYANELITIANGDSVFRGVFQERLAKAEVFCSNFVFNQDHLIDPKHQGDYSSEDRVTVSSSFAVGNKKEDIRRFLLASSVVLSEQDPFTKNDKFIVSNTRGWRRLFLKERSSAPSVVLKKYLKYREETMRANLSWREVLVEDLSGVKELLTQGVYKLGRGVVSAFGRESYKVWADLFEEEVEVSPVVAENKLEKKAEAETIYTLTETEHDLLLKEGWAIWSNEKVFLHFLKHTLTATNPVIDLNQASENFIRTMRGLKSSSAPYALPPTQLNHTDPDDFLSSIMHGAETIFGVFDEICEANPCTAFYSSCLYALGGIAVVNPELAKTILAKMNMGALADSFIAWNLETAKMMSKGVASGFISAGVTLAQEAFLLSQLVSQAGDSAGGDLYRALTNHPIKVAGGVAAAYGLGCAVTTDSLSSVPLIGVIGEKIKEDAGTVPFFEQFAAGMKMATLAQETLHSKPEGQSFLANVIAFALKCVLYPLRLALSLVNVGLGIVKDRKHFKNAIKPWKELLNDSASILLRIADASLRLLNLTGRAVRRVFKLTSEFLINTVTVIAKFVSLPFCSAKENSFTQGLIQFKTSAFAFFGGISRKIKDKYRQSRHVISHELQAIGAHRSSTALIMKANKYQEVTVPLSPASGDSVTPVSSASDRDSELIVAPPSDQPVAPAMDSYNNPASANEKCSSMPITI